MPAQNCLCGYFSAWARNVLNLPYLPKLSVLPKAKIRLELPVCRDLNLQPLVLHFSASAIIIFWTWKRKKPRKKTT